MVAVQDFEGFKRGSKESFRKIFDTFYRGLFLFAQQYVSENDLAEDFVQEVFVTLWEKRNTIEDYTTIKAFLYVSVRNKALNHIKHQKVIAQHQKEVIQTKSQTTFFMKHLIREETYRLLLQAIDELSGQTKKVCVMTMQGLQNAEIAEELQLTTSTIKYHKKQAFKYLRERLKDHLYLLPLIIDLLEF